MLKGVSVCCSVLHFFVLWQCVAVCLQCVPVMLQRRRWCSKRRETHIFERKYRCVAVCCSVLQCVAVCCNVLQLCCSADADARNAKKCVFSNASSGVLQRVAVRCNVLLCVAVILQHRCWCSKRKETCIFERIANTHSQRSALYVFDVVKLGSS